MCRTLCGLNLVQALFLCLQEKTFKKVCFFNNTCVPLGVYNKKLFMKRNGETYTQSMGQCQADTRRYLGLLSKMWTPTPASQYIQRPE